MGKPKFIFSETSITGKLPENPTPADVCASALCDWAYCMQGAKPPQNFGIGMTKVAAFLGGATPEYLMRIADTFNQDQK